MSKKRKLIKNELGYFEFIKKPSANELNLYYKDKYYQNEVANYKKKYSQEELDYLNIKIDQQKYLIEKMINIKKGKMIDIGCGEGHTMKRYYDLGWNVRGVDFSKTGLEQTHLNMLQFARIGDINKIIDQEIKEKNKYDFINMKNVLEHVIDPIGILKKLKIISANKGCLAVTVPNDFSDLQNFLISDGCVNSQYWVCYPDHLNYFNYNSLQNIARHTDWNCQTIIADLPIDWNLLNHNSNYIIDKSKGSIAHHSRIKLEKIIHSKNDMVNIIDFYSSLAKIGQGRDLTAFMIKN